MCAVEGGMSQSGRLVCRLWAARQRLPRVRDAGRAPVWRAATGWLEGKHKLPIDENEREKEKETKTEKENETGNS